MPISEYESLEAVSRLAQGIAEHGEAFAAWAAYVGLDQLDEAARTFHESYLGQYESMEAYVEQHLADADAYAFEQSVPEWLRPYVKLNLELLARDWTMDLHVVEARNGGVLVFETRAMSLA